MSIPVQRYLIDANVGSESGTLELSASQQPASEATSLRSIASSRADLAEVERPAAERGEGAQLAGQSLSLPVADAHRRNASDRWA